MHKRFWVGPSWVDGFGAGVSYIVCAQMVVVNQYVWALIWGFFAVWWTWKEIKRHD